MAVVADGGTAVGPGIRGGAEDPACRERRRGAFLIAAEYTEPRGAGLCASAGSGPAAGDGYDLALTEVVSAAGHRFLFHPGSGAEWSTSREETRQ